MADMFLAWLPKLALVSSWIGAILAAGSACLWLGGHHAYGAHTRGQVALAIALCGTVATWVAVEAETQLQRWLRSCSSKDYVAVGLQEEGESPHATKIGGATSPTEDYVAVGLQEEGESPPATKIGGATSPMEDMEAAATTPETAHAKAEPLPAQSPLHGALAPLRAGAELSGILAFAYLCDRTEVLGRAPKVHDPRCFWAAWALICIAALCTVRKLPSSKPMQREQTDEWKGWMQIMFLMYHYFAEKEVYNAIRVYIAAYVWMTGYGNLLLYAKGKSFTTRRTLQMLFRLNFLGCVVCIALQNEYLLYYICAMHSFFTVLVVLAMYIKQNLNESTVGVYGKIAVTLGFTIVVYDGPSTIFKGIFGTLPGVRPLFAFHDPVHPEFADEMHEWHFRSGLDRFIWIVGMAQALHVASFEKLLDRISALPSAGLRAAAHGGLALPALLAGGAWWHYVFRLEKYAYNRKHAFTSFVPICIFLLLRNLTPALRQRYLWLFAYLGKVTLETYILQFHIWMRTTGINGSPKYLVALVPCSYFANLALTTIIYIFLSIRLSHITTTLRDALIPEGLSAIGLRWACACGAAATCWAVSHIFVGPGAPFSNLGP